MTKNMEVRIERMVYGGDGLGRIEGRVALVPLVLPGELVEIAPEKRDPKLLRGRPTKIIERAPNRVVADCPYFARCGGCNYQHAPYEDQIRYKAEILVETLRRIGKLTAPEPETVADDPWHYRNRAQFKVIGGRLGFFAAGSERLVEIAECPISSPGINAMIPELARIIKRQDFPNGPSELEIVDSGAEMLITIRSEGQAPETLVSAFRERVPGLVSLARADSAGGFFPLWGRGHTTCHAAGFDYRLSHGVFFQVNRHLADALVDISTRDLSGDLALDLYAGGGFFTIPLARRFTKVEAVESSNAASKDLRANCTRAGLANVEAHRDSTAEFLARRQHKSPDAVLVDPPRAGLGQATSRQLAALHPSTIVYVSCDPPTLARDLSVLTAAGYQMEKLYMVDLFPQTFHLEAVVILRLK
jgi:23S rRNA (uracil1939-C5)-methyltransferase